MTKKIFAMFLAVLMVVSMLPTSVFADGTTGLCPGKEYEHTKENCTEDESKRVIVAPTCEKWGYTLRYCFDCGKGFATDPTEPLKHELEQIEGEKAPTCTEPGYGSKWGCTRCEYTETREDTEALGHDMQPVGVVDCEKGGKLTYKCTRCDHTEEIDIDPGKHMWGEWILSKKATAEEEGEAYRECEACGAKQTVNVYYHDHVFFTFEEIPATCTTDGVEGYVECRICGKRYLNKEAKEEDEIKSDEDLVIPAGHVEDDGVVTTAPNCTDKGVKTYTCTVCGATRTEDIDALGHTEDEGVVTTEPNCTDKGVKTYTCTVCGATRTEDIDALGHTWNITEPSCKDTERTCTVCGATEPVTPGEHDWYEVKTQVETNCVEDGAAFYKCRNCTATDVKPLDHDWDDGVVTKDPTCTEKGTKRFTCNRENCGATKEEDIDELGHDYGEWTTVKKPTCTADGLKTRVCGRANCEDPTDFEVIEATGHEELEITVKATCVTYGFSYTICTNENCPVEAKKTVVVDGYTYYLQDAEGNKAAVHLLSNLTIDVTAGKNEHNHAEFVITEVLPTCKTDGYKIECCTACTYRKEYKAADYPKYKMTGHAFTNETIVEPNACGVEGLKHIACANKDCKVSYYEVIPANTHNYVLDEAQSTCQKQIYVCHEKNCDGDECLAVKEVLGFYDDYDLHNWEIVETHYAMHTEHNYYTALKCTLCQTDGKLDGVYTTVDGEIVADPAYVDENGAPITHWEYCNSCQEHSYIFETLADAKDKHIEKLEFITSDSAVTCEANGVDRYYCKDCKYDVLVKNNEGIGHKFATVIDGSGCLKEGTELLDENGLPKDYIKESTCTEIGYHYYSGCTVKGCRYYNEKAGTVETIPMKDHEYETISDPCATPSFGEEEKAYAACKNCGAAKYNKCVIEFQQDAENLCTDYTYLIYSCGECGKMHALYFYGKFGHDMVKIDEVAPTYTDAGYELWKCRFCDHTEENEIAKLVCEHPEDQLELIETVDPTCLKEGYTEYECKICGETVYTYTDKIDHTNKDGEVIDPICKEGYDIAKHTCTMCGRPILEHDMVFEGHRDATCLEPGYDFSRCSRCGEEGDFKWFLNEPAKNPEHAYIEELIEDYVRVEPTYENEGYESYRCVICGETFTNVIPKLDGLEMNMTLANANGREGYTYGSLVELTIKLNGNDANVSSFAFNVQIPKGLSFVEAKANTLNFSMVKTTDAENANEKGVIEVIGWNLKNVNVTGEQEILKLYFRVVENTAETYDFAFGNVKFSRKDAELGTVDMACNTFAASFTTALFLDVNGDGVVDTADLFKAMDLYFDEEIDAEYNVVYDVNKDGEIDITDIIALRDYVLGNLTIDDLFNKGI